MTHAALRSTITPVDPRLTRLGVQLGVRERWEASPGRVRACGRSESAKVRFIGGSCPRPPCRKLLPEPVVVGRLLLCGVRSEQQEGRAH